MQPSYDEPNEGEQATHAHEHRSDHKRARLELNFLVRLARCQRAASLGWMRPGKGLITYS